MATRARIGIKQKSGRIIASYQHWDGYPGGLGYNLCEHWEDKKKVTEAIKLGDSSKWHYIIGDKIDFDDRSNPMYEVQNCYYGRDRGEKNVGYKVYKDEAEYIREGFNSGEQFFQYLKDGFDVLYAEGETAPKMMSIGLHCRLVGRPSRAASLAKFLDYVLQHDHVWVARRVDIAKHWISTFPHE